MKEFLKQCREDLEGKLKGYTIKLKINGVISNESNDEGIYYKEIKEASRLSRDFSKNLTLQVTVDNYAGSLLSGILTEFPSCCGKAILHTMSLNDEFTYYDKYYNLSEHSQDMMQIFFTLLKESCIRLGYSSVDLVISEHDNKNIFKYVDSVSILKRVNTFKNIRNNHICHDYLLNLG